MSSRRRGQVVSQVHGGDEVPGVLQALSGAEEPQVLGAQVLAGSSSRQEMGALIELSSNKSKAWIYFSQGPGKEDLSGQVQLPGLPQLLRVKPGTAPDT